MAEVLERFTPAAAEACRAAIRDAGGNEVFLLATLDAGKVAEVRVLARGNRHAAPAILKIPRPGEVVIHNHPDGPLVPSDADLEVSSALGQDGVGSYIVDNELRRLYVVVEPHASRQARPVSPAAPIDLLGPKGRIAAALPGYEHRPPQLEMAASVTAAFNEHRVLTAEAGTGTGKSLAYLVPAILWAKANEERVIVSTHTINLQEQLVQKDLPFLVERAGLTCKVALVKGRGNYLCRRKAAQAEAQQPRLVEDELSAELRQLLAWAKTTQDGSLADLPVRPRAEVWEQVVSENDNCLRARCPHYSTCFFYTARRNAAAADVLVVNHHLLMADLALRAELDSAAQNAVLPPAKCVVIDEAHHLEDVATSYFGARISLAMIERPLSRLQSARTASKGVLPALMAELDGIDSGEDKLVAKGAVAAIVERLLPRRGRLGEEAEEVFATLLSSFTLAAPPSAQGLPEIKLRVTEQVRSGKLWSDVKERLGNLAASLDGYADDFAAVFERIGQLSPSAEKKVLSLATELRALVGRLSNAAASLELFLAANDGLCRWIEHQPRSRSGPQLSFHAAPVDVAALLRRSLFEKFSTAVLTSATLAVDRGFEFLHARIGVNGLEDRSRVRTLQVASPFDFERQALLAVPTDLPEASRPQYEPATHAAIRELVRLSDGGAFVLFTAYGALNRAFQALERELRKAGMTPLRQGETSRPLLLQRFVKSPRAVLFATDSFWEGVDVKGEALRQVIIARLPFKVPSEPIEQARVEEIEARGGDPFTERSLPQAVIKLKQGFGRLIRSRSDRGAVVILDSRIAHKRYGQVFLASLPPARRVIAPSARVYDAVGALFTGSAA